MIRYAAAILVAGIAAVSLVNAGGTPQKLMLGAPAPNFTNLPGVDGKMHSLDEYKNKDVLVITITCNHCPVAVGYEDRIIDFAKKYTTAPDSKVALVAINVNNIEQDKLDKMKIRAQQKGFNFPYLYDESQAIARALSARVTPEFYVFNKERKLVYWGSLDNSQTGPKTNYLSAAVDATLKNETPTTAKTNAFGCGIKYERK
jgi:peroxiredoxin